VPNVRPILEFLAGNTFLNLGAAYLNQMFTGWIPPGSAVAKSELLSDDLSCCPTIYLLCRGVDHKRFFVQAIGHQIE
jgi:hypothetical protein